jgi:GNAT superfamily N-acetyltransferase
VSDPKLDALAEAARNRGLKLVRSRVRSPGKRRFGKVGLTDAKGKAIFGMDAKGPIGEPDEVEDFLRNLGAKDWGASLDVAVLPRKKKAKREPANDAEPMPKKAPPAPQPPKPKIRDAKASDAPQLVVLMKLLGHDVDANGVRKRLSALAKEGLPQLIATLDKAVVGLCGIHRMVAVHRSNAVGRITILVVASEARGHGIGRMLAEGAETRLKDLGCGMVEVTSNDRLGEAHAFYRHMGYERTSIRFAKKL